MRLLTSCDTQPTARFLRDALIGGGVPASLKIGTGTDETYAVWVHNDGDLELAEELLAAYEADPNDPRIAELARIGPVEQRRQEREQKKYAREVERIKRATEVEQPGSAGAGVVTLGFIALCIGVAVFTDGGEHGLGALGFNLRAILAGEVWRLFTPAIAHLGILHIGFNLLWIYSFGRRIEGPRRSRYFLAQLVVFGLAGVLADGFIGYGTGFGASGIVYGLAGFLFVYGRFVPTSPMQIGVELFILLMVFWGIGYLAPAMRVANWAHTGGLVAGLIWGALAGVRARGRSH